MNRTAWIAALGAFFPGLLLGLLAGRLARPEAPATVPPAARSTAIPSSPEVRTPAAPSVRESDEVVPLKRRISELESGGRTGRSPEELSQLAVEIRKGMSSTSWDDDVRGYCRFMGLLAQLGPALTPYFVRMYREGRPKPDPVLLELAVGSGGPELAPLLKDIFGNPSTPSGERIMAGLMLTGEGYASRMQSPLPPDSELVDLALQTLASTNVMERDGGIGLLGLQATDRSREALLGLLVDGRPGLRADSLRALGRVGDSSTLEYLRSYATTTFPQLSLKSDLQDGKLSTVERALLGTLRQLERRFPEK